MLFCVKRKSRISASLACLILCRTTCEAVPLVKQCACKSTRSRALNAAHIHHCLGAQAPSGGQVTTHSKLWVVSLESPCLMSKRSEQICLARPSHFLHRMQHARIAGPLTKNSLHWDQATAIIINNFTCFSCQEARCVLQATLHDKMFF